MVAIASFTNRYVGTSGGSLIHVLWNEFGPEVAKRLLNEVQAVVNCWLLSQGFSVGIGDTIADSVTLEDITRAIKVISHSRKDRRLCLQFSSYLVSLYASRRKQRWRT